jgi:hypothetical protein
MVYASTLKEPDEVQTLSGCLLQLTAGSDVPDQTVENHSGHKTRVYRRLTLVTVIFTLPISPVHPLKQLI